MGVTVVSPRVGASRWSPRDTSTYLLTYPPPAGVTYLLRLQARDEFPRKRQGFTGYHSARCESILGWVHDTLTWKHARLLEQGVFHALRRREFIAVAVVRI